MIDPGLKDRVVAITGANNPRGIGAATARAFAAQNAKIFLHYFRVSKSSSASEADSTGPDEAPGESLYYRLAGTTAEEVMMSLSELGAHAYAWEADLSDADTATRLFREAERVHGPIEILVNNAAHWEADTLLPPKVELAAHHVELWTDRPASFSPGSFDRTFSVNARAVALLMAEFAKRHKARGANWGRIVNLSTDGAYMFPSEVSYGASKLALEGLSRSAAAEFGKLGITVNIVSPGPIQTGWITPELENEIVGSTPLGRVGEPKDVADVVVFLASEQARWVTGQTIHVGGGHAM